MSADLLEAFGGNGFEPQGQPRQPTQLNDKPLQQNPGQHGTGLIYQRTFDSEAQPPKPQNESLWTAREGGNDVLFDATDEESGGQADDDFGDFEDVEQLSAQTRAHALAVATEKKPPHALKEAQSEAPLVDLLSLDDVPGHISSTPISSSGPAPLNESFASEQLPATSQPISRPPLPNEDDGWGDFEAPGDAQREISSSRGTQSGKNVYSTGAFAEAQPQAPPSDFQPDDDWDAFEDGQTEPARPVGTSHPHLDTNPAHTTSRITTDQSLPTDDDEWDAFEDGKPIPESVTATTTAEPPSKPSPHPSSTSNPTTSATPPSATRPTNIPPPSTLLSLLPTVISTLSSTTPPPTAPQIQHLYHTTARIAAARSLRWRRDTLLSQSTRISAAGAAGKSGMKLSSLNKGEAAREEREAAEALAAWNGGVPKWHGVLREGGVKVESKGKGLRLRLPLGVRGLSAREGGMEAAYVCPVCGMKRSERVVGVDEGEEDVFGEFWVEGWGHRACAEVWYAWKGLLGQR
ncbi:uncharacterized protein HMPREF1541_09448 [Cyphellophora europaea CBS 101466]|uniref:Uncharacterized protein n=1 Tax=Cyphellophora europaea (strain CBS 101466) TaxID=1220924 RepID=W2SA56_CYPE1|nr:uncharacterized protein HMPREF1541_09448 [Cyphellophora europaea CBS 101466]ETN45616.1 hypothetical protein HMPREF1541_09448 [Cyphellophora europaea CBS 101466]